MIGGYDQDIGTKVLGQRILQRKHKANGVRLTDGEHEIPSWQE